MFASLPQLPADPILGLSAAFAQDTAADKVDLGVGVYKNDQGQTPILASVRAAEARRLAEETTKAYTAPGDYPGANSASQQLAFGAQHPTLRDQRLSTIQTPGGCGALRVAAELINRSQPGATVWVSLPTWGNHIPLLSGAGLQLREYPYYDAARHCIDFDRMMATLTQAEPGDLVLLHASCHNPSGADLSPEQWRSLTELAATGGFIPFIDMAYQGFGEGVEEDAFGLRLMAEQLPELVLATSYSKNFGLYRERAGSLSILSDQPSVAQAVTSQLLSITRGLYSMPPSHGAAIVDIIYHDPQLYAQWLEELTQMRERIQHLRRALVQRLNSIQSQRDFGFIQAERGMFSFLGLSVEQVQRLRHDWHIYMTDNSRINVAGLQKHSIEAVAQAIAQVL